MARTSTPTPPSLLCRLGLRVPPQYRSSAELIQRSRQLQAIAQRLCWSLPSPLDAAPLVRRATHFLFAAVLALEGEPATSAADGRQRILDSPDFRAIFAEIVDDLPMLDELSSSLEPVADESAGPRERFLGLMKRLPGVQRKVEARYDAKLRAAGARSRPTLVLGLLGVIGTATFAGLLWHRRSAAARLEAEALSATPPSSAGAAAGSATPPEGRCFEATFFSDAKFATPVHTRRDCQIAFDWGEAAVPDVPSLAADSFSIRWEGVLRPPRSEPYRFQLKSDDGSRLYLNNVLVVDNWGAHGPEERGSEPIDLAAGAEVPIVVEYYEVGEIAQVKLTWSSPTMPQQILTGQYVEPRRAERPAGSDAAALDEAWRPSDCFVGRYFAGRHFERLVQERRDCRIAFDWAFASPAGVDGLSEDDFSVRWEGTLRVPKTDEYSFHLASDDGSRLLLEGKEVVGDFSEHGSGWLVSEPLRLTQGVDYPLVVEFFESKELASVRLEWSSSTLPRQPLTGRHVSAPPSHDGSPRGGQGR